MFQTAQWALSSEAAGSLAQMAARSTRGDAALAALVRERQDLVEEWQRRDGVRSAAVSQGPDKRDRVVEAANVTRLLPRHRIADIDKRLAMDFPIVASRWPGRNAVGGGKRQGQFWGERSAGPGPRHTEWKPTPKATVRLDRHPNHMRGPGRSGPREHAGVGSRGLAETPWPCSTASRTLARRQSNPVLVNLDLL